MELHKNFRLGRKGLPRTNTLAFYEHSLITNVKSFILLGDLVFRDGQNNVKTSGDDFVIFCRRNAVQAVPAAGGVIAALVANAVAEVIAAVRVKVLVALPGGRLVTVVAVEEALLPVAGFVAVAVFEDVPAVLSAAGRRVAVLPGVEADPAVAAVVVAGVGVALFVATVVALLLAATVVDALLPVLRTDDDVVDAAGMVDASRGGLVADVAIFPAPTLV